MKGKVVTISDIAKRLGVSAATVSRALKDHPDISMKTKTLVRELAKEMNYRPNTMAQGLRQRHSKIIGVIIPELIHHFFSSVITGIMGEAYSQGFKVMLCQSGESYEKELIDANMLLESRVDGLLVSLSDHTDQFEHLMEFKRAGIPMVFFDKSMESEEFSSVTVNDFEGAFAAVTHMLEQGYRRIAHLSGPQIPITSRERLRGYKAALDAYGIPFKKELVRICSSVNRYEGEQNTLQLMQQHPEVDGIFAVADQVAIGVLVALQKLQIAVPEQVGVVGFSNWDISEVVKPSLTTVAQPGKEMGIRATKLLIADILNDAEEEAPQAPTQVKLPTQLIVRESSTGKKRP